MQAVHAVLMLRETRQYSRAARRTTTDGRKRSRKDEAPFRKRVDIWSLYAVVSVDWSLKTSVVKKYKKNVFLGLRDGG